MATELSQRSNSFIKKLMMFLWSPLKFIFRLEVEGAENIPKDGAFMLIANHNSGALIESHSLLFLCQDLKRDVYGLNHPALFKIPLVSKYFRKIGAITASKEVGLQALNAGCGLLIFPGGNRQALRPYREKDQNAFPWAKGWASLAIEASRSKETPVIPVKFIGSHGVNPILICNQFVSKILMLPWLLGVKWFPISLAQIIFSIVTLSLLNANGAHWAMTAVASYIVFLATCLIPVLPRKIRIKIYPALKADERLIDTMSAVMSKADYPQGRQHVYALNGIERFMLLHESSALHYNSHFVFEFNGQLDKQKFLDVTNKWIQNLPQVRSVIESGYWQSQRYVYKKAWFDASEITTFSDLGSDAQADDFCHQPFALAFQPSVRFLVQSIGEKNRVVFSCHHSLFDGAAQAFAFEEWSRIYNGENERPKYQNCEQFQFRSAIKHFGLRKSFKLVIDNLRFSPPRIQMRLGHLNSKADTGSRKVIAKTIKLNTKKSIRDDFYSVAARAFDRALTDAGKKDEPLLFYLPTGLRFLLKVKASLQNIVVSHTLFLKRDKVNSVDLKTIIKAKISQNPLNANAKFIFGVLPLCAFGIEKRMQKLFKKLDSVQSVPSCSGLLVNAAIPRGFTTPKGWNDLYISARGTLLKAPSVGLIFTGKPGFETITVQYIEGLVDENDITSLIRSINTQIQALGLVGVQENKDLEKEKLTTA